MEAVIPGEGVTGVDDDLEAAVRSAGDMHHDRDTSCWNLEAWQKYKRKYQLWWPKFQNVVFLSSISRISNSSTVII